VTGFLAAISATRPRLLSNGPERGIVPPHLARQLADLPAWLSRRTSDLPPFGNRSGTELMVSRIFTASRFLVILAVVGCFIGSASLFAYGLAAVVRIVWATVRADLSHMGAAERHVVVVAERLAVDLIQLADVFLLGTVIYLVGLGLHLLFINPQLPAQPWMAVSDLDDLKEMLVRVIALLVGVTFLGSFVEHADDVPVIELGVTTAVVVLAFTLVILVAKLPDWAKGERASRLHAGDEDLSPRQDGRS
jgi:uncharacterized membrane protein YqhA